MRKTVQRVLCLIFAVLLISGTFGACKKGNDGSSASTSGNSTGANKSAPSASAKTNGASATKSSTTAPGTNGGTVAAGDTNAQGGQSTSGGNTSAGQTSNDGQPGSDNGQGGSVAGGAASGKTIDLGGRKLVFASRNAEPTLGQSALGDIQYRSWKNAEKKYNFVMEWKYVQGGTGVIAQDFINNVMAGVHYADAVGLSSKQTFPGMADQGMIMPIDDYLDFSSPLYNSPYCLSSAQWRGKHYGFQGPAAASTYGYWYNRTLFNNEGLEDPQNMVDAGNWNWDTFLAAALATTKDLNGDGLIDQWGISGHRYNEGTWLLFSNGCDIIRNDNGKFAFGMSTPQAIKALQFYSDLWNVYKVVVHDGSSTQSQIFLNGQSAMFAHATYTGTAIKASGMTDYGFVVLPKGPDVSECQRVVDSTSFWAYPSTLPNPQEVVPVLSDILTIWDPSEEEYVTVDDMLKTGAQNYFADQRDIDHYFRYVPSGKLLSAYSFGDAMNIVSKDIVDKVSKMEVTAAAAVEANAQICQESIDALTGQ